MEIDVTKIPNLLNGLIQVDGIGNVSVDDSVYTGGGKII